MQAQTRFAERKRRKQARDQMATLESVDKAGSGRM